MFPTTEVSGIKSGKSVTINIDNSAGMLTSPVYSVVAKLKPGCRPAMTYNVFAGVQGGAWLMVSVTPDGDVCVYHMFASGNLTWAPVYASLTFTTP